MSQNIPKHPKTSQNIPKHPKTSQSIPKYPKISQNIPKDPERSQNIPKDPAISQKIPKDPRISQNIPNPPERSKYIPKYAGLIWYGWKVATGTKCPTPNTGTKCLPSKNTTGTKCLAYEHPWTTIITDFRGEILSRDNIWQDVIWIEKKCAEIKLLKKSMNMWFLCFWGFIMAVGNQIIQKNIKKLLSGYFLAYPPKMHYSAPQCSAMYCSVNAWIIHSRWVKYDPQWPRMTDYSPGWHTRGQGGTRGSRGAPGGARGR